MAGGERVEMIGRALMMWRELLATSKAMGELKRENSEMRFVLWVLLKQYRDFRMLSNTTMEEAQKVFGEPPADLMKLMVKKGFINHEVDVIPRKEYVALAEAYEKLATRCGRLAADHEKLVAETIEKARKDKEKGGL